MAGLIASHALTRASIVCVCLQVIDLKLEIEERDERLSHGADASKRAAHAERELNKAREEMRRGRDDLMTLVSQKGELQLENASLHDMVADLRQEKDLILDAKEELHDRIETLEDEIELLARSAQDMAALQHGRSKKDSKSGDKGAGGGGEDQLSAMPSFTRAGSSFTRRRADTASAMPSPRGGLESYSMPSMPEDRVVASTRTSFAVGGGGSAPTTPRGGASGGRTRQESKGGFGWPFGKKE